MNKHTLLQGLEAMPGDGALLVALGNVLERDGDWRTLRDVLLDHWPRMPPGSPQEGQIIYLIAKACLELSDWLQAVRLASRAANLLPRFPYVHHILGRALARLGRLQEAMEAQHRCAELEPSFPWCWFEIGSIALDLGDPAAARSAFQRALSEQQVADADSTAIIRQELLRAEHTCLWEEREAAARHLWPDRPPLQPDEALPALEHLALMTEEFRLFLDKMEVQLKPGRS